MAALSSIRGGQVAMEFMLLLGASIFVVVSFLAVTLSVSRMNTNIHYYASLDDLGKSLQQEFLLASQLEDGYVRRINIPSTIDGLDYNISYNQSGLQGYITLGQGSSEIYYFIPEISGNITKGYNYIRKNDGNITVSQS